MDLELNRSTRKSESASSVDFAPVKFSDVIFGGGGVQFWRVLRVKSAHFGAVFRRILSSLVRPCQALATSDKRGGFRVSICFYYVFSENGS